MISIICGVFSASNQRVRRTQESMATCCASTAVVTVCDATVVFEEHSTDIRLPTLKIVTKLPETLKEVPDKTRANTRTCR